MSVVHQSASRPARASRGSVVGVVLEMPAIWQLFGYAVAADGHGVQHAFATAHYPESRILPLCGRMRVGVGYVHPSAFPRVQRCQHCERLVSRVDAGQVSLDAVALRAARKFRLRQRVRETVPESQPA